MSNIAIKGAATGSGTFTLEAPATSTNRTLTLPDEAGTILTTATAGVLTNLDQILHVRDEKTAGTEGGSSVAGNQVRTLNTVVRNTIAGASLASNQITLPAGTYTINARSPAYKSNRHRVRLVNVTDSVVLLRGSSEHTGATDNVSTDSCIVGVFTLGATNALNLTHYILDAAATYGLGLSGGDTFVDVYAEAYITKIG